MIFLFKKTRNFAILASILWAVAVVVGRFTVFTEYKSTLSGIVSPVVALLCGLYLVYSFANREARKTHRAYTEILSRDCDADLFVSVYEEVREQGRKKNGTVYLTESSYATGLHLAGRSAEALEIVKALTLRPDFSRGRAVDRADAFVDVGIYSLSLGDLDAVEAAIGSAEEILSSMTVGSAEYNRIYREIERLRHRRDVALGQCDAALEYFTDSAREYTSTYAKVNRMYTLSEIYRRAGDGEQLKKCLSYIARHGGTLKIAKDAREELGEE